jgi:hypothetical protein
VDAEVLALAQSLCGGAMKGVRRKRTNGARAGAQSGQNSGVRPQKKQAGPSTRSGAQTSKNLSATASKRMRKALPGKLGQRRAEEMQSTEPSVNRSKAKGFESMELPRQKRAEPCQTGPY